MLTLQYDFNFFWILAYKNSVLFFTCFILFRFRSFSKATCDMNFIRIVFKCKRWYVYLTHCSFFLEVNKSLTKTIWIVKKKFSFEYCSWLNREWKRFTIVSFCLVVSQIIIQCIHWTLVNIKLFLLELIVDLLLQLVDIKYFCSENMFNKMVKFSYN